MAEHRAVREELDTVERELTELRQTAAGLRRDIGGRADGATDPEDVASAITAVEEQEAMVAALERRRDRLRGELGEQP